MANGPFIVASLKHLSGRSVKRRIQRQRRRSLLAEQLEQRQVLAANPFSAPDPTGTAAEVQPLAEDHEVLAISAVHIRVGDTEYTVSAENDVVPVDPGQHLQVVGVEYRLREGASLEGEIAMEGCLRKLSNSGRSSYDYDDGRYGSPVQNGPIPEGSSLHPGLEGGWDMQQGYEMLQLNLVRNNGRERIVEDRVTIRLQVGTPDFEMRAVRIRPRGGVTVAGQMIRLYGAWRNLGEGLYRNYAKVEIYHESDPTRPVWTGSFGRLARGERIVRGEFLQRSRGIPRRWVPKQTGTYTLKFSADPDDRWVEDNESNNGIAVQLQVFGNRRQARVAGERGDVWKWWSSKSRIRGRFATVEASPADVPHSQLAAVRQDPLPSVPDSIFDTPDDWADNVDTALDGNDPWMPPS